MECVIAYCSRALRPSQRKYCTTKLEMLAAVSMCIQFSSYLRGDKFTLRTDHKSPVWLHHSKDTEGMMACVDCPPVDTTIDAESVDDSEDADLVPL